MFTFTWDELVTDELLEQLDQWSGEDTATYRDQMRLLVTGILRNTGGLPIVPSQLDTSQRTSLAEELLSDAIGNYLGTARSSAPAEGYYLTSATVGGLERRIESMAVVDINRADESTLKALPAIGTSRAREIVKERAENGYFASMDELVTRIKGIGAGTALTLQNVTRFEVPLGALLPLGPSDSRLGRVLNRALTGFVAINPGLRLRALLEAVRMVTARVPHPVTLQQRPRYLREPHLHTFHQANVVGVLENESYYERLPAFLKAATASIRVAMFHAAFPGPNHPTRILLDELIAAKARGLDVRVILDRDRETDPYMSTVINSRAKRYLEDNGVECRFDKEDVLLHSKYVILDENLCIVGSHNWSAGSYFNFDDLSLVVHSHEVATTLVARFEHLWG